MRVVVMLTMMYHSICVAIGHYKMRLTGGEGVNRKFFFTCIITFIPSNMNGTCQIVKLIEHNLHIFHWSCELKSYY